MSPRVKIDVIHFGADARLHMRSGCVERGDRQVRIAGRRLGMLAELAMNLGQVVSQSRLWVASRETAGRGSRGGGEQTTRMHVCKLRNEIEPLGLRIETVPHQGWRLTVGEMPERQTVPQPPAHPDETGTALRDDDGTVRGLMQRGFGLQAIARITGRNYAETAAAMEQARSAVGAA